MIFSHNTLAPLPRLFDLLRVPFVKVPSTESLSAIWRRNGDVAQWFSRSAWSLVAISQWSQRVTGKSTITFWVPNYFCNESLGLLRQMGVHLIFYPIDELCNPDLDQFPIVSSDNRPDLFLIVHYFGEPSPCNGALKFCKEHGALLVEDAAHVLKPVPGVGESGDCVLYSPHKLLAIPDGSLLVIRKDGPSLLGMHDNWMAMFDEVVKNMLPIERTIDHVTVFWLIKRLIQRLGVRLRLRPSPFSLNIKNSEGFFGPPGMSKMAKRLISYELGRINEISLNRIRCKIEWTKMISSVYPASDYQVMPVGQIPYLSCIISRDQKTAEALYTRLKSVGVPVATWPDLPPEVAGSSNEHIMANRLRLTRIYLPVHQDFNIHHITLYGKRLRKLIPFVWRLESIASQEVWEGFWLGCRRKSLTQTWEYGSAKAAAEGWQAQHFVVFDENNLPTALFQVLVKKLPWLGGVARINRGPLMLQDEPEGECRLALNSIAVLVSESRRRGWLMVQIAPLLPPGERLESALLSLGFRRQPNCPADSALVSLVEDEDVILMRINGKWRNGLRKGQKLGVKVHIDEGGRLQFKLLLDFYKQQQIEKRFDGTSDNMLRALVDNQSPFFKFNLFVAIDESDSTQGICQGVLVTLQFGDVSEYLIGATNERGRLNQANSVLLWEAILDAKKNGCKWFDVGGLSKNTTAGIAAFKKGLNPEPYGLVGEWRRWF
jgi:hypothetical protein